MELADGSEGAGAAIGCAGAGACGIFILSLIFVGCSPALAYAGIVNGSGRSDINFLKYSY